MLQVVFKLIGMLIVLLGIILIYDARIITKKFFGLGDQNDGAKRFEDYRANCFYCWWINCIFCVKLKVLEILLYLKL